ncbi:MAG: bifunctional metallophosphatase/5'-nucleotidase [Holophagaceae bacterium]|nr:bifunctional metallophosphatase/5'-nucleotidase [Holophagaceae bacterium]
MTHRRLARLLHACFTLCFAGLLGAGALFAQELKLQVLGTTDLHGHVLPQDTYSLQPRNKGWAKLATLIRQAKAENPNSVLIDSGDTIEGEPVNYVRTRLRPDMAEPSIAVMNALGFSAMAIGNHDFNWGLDALRAVEKQARFPLLSANTVLAKGGKGAFTPWTKVNIGGATVVIVGFTTPGIPHMEEPGNYAGLAFQDIVESAKALVPRLREKEKADVIIVTMHSGLGALPGQAGDENSALRLADQVPGIDLILTGHTHAPISSQHKGVPILQAAAHGRALAVADLTLQKSQGRWRVAAVRGRLVEPADDTPLDAQVLELTASLRTATDTYLNTAATNLFTDLDGRWCRLEDTPLAQLLHTVQRQATGAQLSVVSWTSAGIFIPAGPTSVRQFYSLQPYENQVARIRISGKQLRLYLEFAARAYNFSHEPELFNKAVPFYEVDQIDGCAYALDLSQPAGKRVKNLSFQGRPVQEDQTFSLALSTYRLRGGGGYMAAIGFTGQPESITPELARNLLLSYVLSRPSLALAPTHAWRTIPALDRERIMQQAR